MTVAYEDFERVSAKITRSVRLQRLIMTVMNHENTRLYLCVPGINVCRERYDHTPGFQLTLLVNSTPEAVKLSKLLGVGHVLVRDTPSYNVSFMGNRLVPMMLRMAGCRVPIWSELKRYGDGDEKRIPQWVMEEAEAAVTSPKKRKRRAA